MSSDSLITEDVRASFQRVIDDSTRAATRMPEQQFVKVFLPVLANGFINGNDEALDIHKWMSVAGGPLRPVDIIDESGEVLFTVPPIYETTGIHSDNSHNSVFDIMSNLKLELQNNPIEADRRIRDRFFTSLDIKGSNQTRFLVNWAFILERYNYPVPWAGGLAGFASSADEVSVKTTPPTTEFEADSFDEV